MLGFAIILTVLLVALQLLVRLAPVDPARWHQPIAGLSAPGTQRLDGGARHLTPPMDRTPDALLATLDRIARDTPRTRVIAGSVAEGRITYETRSAFWGFPDYTTVEARGDDGAAQLALFARLRFGKSDLGVNAARIDRWTAALGQGG
ncbi:DUF1499 domain-containing protein [Actibacterium ureilyticum]|uniref:DUF1499 domain-containing protein n=1 Tax=Actibacterium ureilyticum TaxID=1590614 RepID=UPI000BAABA28|nr:DUF1499 domain-containing protein [Actibacterium ureilyticum]